ncbi:MAG: suppressor of fused domain protein [Leptospiraceae bacterium]|nr:suppressor of fused domain protein [Leptospiraceae bacterium]
MVAKENKLIYQETNPYGSLVAFLEDDGRTVYLYLQSIHNPEMKMRSVWVKNRIPAPISRSESDLRNGLAPILCQEELTLDSEIDEILEKDLYLIWTEDGNGVGIFVKEVLLAFLPSYSGIKDFHGYSRYAKVETLTTHPLGTGEVSAIHNLMNESKRFWEIRAEKNTWKTIQSKLLSLYESKLGKHTMYWSADGGKFPHLAIAKFEPESMNGIQVYVTLGMSAQNMPSVDLYYKDFEKYSRIEMIMAVNSEDHKADQWVPHAIGEIIKFPWVMCKWFGEGHTMTLPRKDPDAVLVDFTHIFFTASPGETSLQDKLFSPPFLGEENSFDDKTFKLLYLIPISEEETHILKTHGSNELKEMIHSSGNGWIHFSERQSYLNYLN